MSGASRKFRCLSVKGRQVSAPAHGLPDGCRVALRGVAGCSHLEGQTFLAKVGLDDTDSFNLSGDVELGVSRSSLVHDENEGGLPLVSIVTAQPHGLTINTDGYFDDSSQVILSGFGRFDGLTFQAIAVSECELHLFDFDYESEDGGHTQGKSGELGKYVSTRDLRGGETILLPDSDSVMEDAVGTGGWIQQAPRHRSQTEIEAAWRATLDGALKGCRPETVASAVVPDRLAITCCGTAACIDCYDRVTEDAAGAAGHASAVYFSRGCIRLAFEPWLGLWAISAELRPEKWDNVHEARLLLGERCLRWEGPQLLYVCLDTSPLGRWVSVLGAEPAPCRVTEIIAELASPTVGLKVGGRWPMDLLVYALSYLLDLRQVDLVSGYLDNSFFACGPRGLSAPMIARHICELEAVACQVAVVSRSWREVVGAWRSLLPGRVHNILYGEMRISEGLEASMFGEAVALMARFDRKTDILRAPEFVNRHWGVVPSNVVLTKKLDPILGLNVLRPAFKSFTRVLLEGAALPLERSSTSFVRTTRPEPGDEDAVEEEWVELLEEPGNLPRAVRSMPSLLCHGASAEMFLPSGKPLKDNLRAATSRLESELLRSRFGAVGPVLARVESQEWQSWEQAAGKCVMHRISSDGAESCEECRRPGGTALDTEMSIGLAFRMAAPGAALQLFNLTIRAFAVPLMARHVDSEAFSVTESQRRRLGWTLGSGLAPAPGGAGCGCGGA